MFPKLSMTFSNPIMLASKQIRKGFLFDALEFLWHFRTQIFYDIFVLWPSILWHFRTRGARSILWHFRTLLEFLNIFMTFSDVTDEFQLQLKLYLLKNACKRILLVTSMLATNEKSHQRHCSQFYLVFYVFIIAISIVIGVRKILHASPQRRYYFGHFCYRAIS